MEELANLLFTLASVDRLTLISVIAEEKLRLTQLAAKLSATTQEASRHISRLQEARVVEKGTDGCLTLTPLGRSLLALIPSFKFLSEHRGYFVAHDITALPFEFMERIGELEGGESGQGVGTVLSHTSKVFREATSYVSLVSDNIMDLQPLGATNASTNLQIRIVVPAASLGATELPVTELGKGVQVGLVDKVSAALALNEKTAGVAFPDLSGRVDFNGGFASDHPRFHKWCEDLFVFYWDKAKPVRAPSKT